MKKIILLILVVILFGALYVYRDTIMGRLGYDRCTTEEVWNEAEKRCVPSISGDPDVYPETFTLNDITSVVMTLEDAPQRIITVTRDTSSAQPFSATFGTEPVGNGMVMLLDTNVAYQNTTGDIFIPFSANYGGSGSFVSLGLFAREGDSSLVLRDSYLLGDRIAFDSMTIEGADTSYTVRVDIRDRKSGDAMAMLPTVPKIVRIPVANHAFGEGKIESSESASVRYKDLIAVSVPQTNGVISSPLTVQGEARGNWYFEASFPITVVDWDGVIIGEGYAEAQDEWMTTEYVPFKGTINFTVPENTPYRRGAIIFKKDNPSGLPENDDALEIPVLFE